MITIPIFADARYAVNRKRLRDAIDASIRTEGIRGDVQVAVSVIGNRKMRALFRQYRGKDEVTDVLSFAYDQVRKPFKDPPGQARHLGEIVISYPQVVDGARRRNRLIDDELEDVAAHGTKHLLGYDHDALGRWYFKKGER